VCGQSTLVLIKSVYSLKVGALIRSRLLGQKGAFRKAATKLGPLCTGWMPRTVLHQVCLLEFNEVRRPHRIVYLLGLKADANARQLFEGTRSKGSRRDATSPAKYD
jgi:hypothetical protein